MIKVEKDPSLGSPRARHVSLPEFLNQLFEQGRVVVGEPTSASRDAELRAADAILADWERHVRDEFPGQAPSLVLPAARWAAVMLYRGCQLAVWRQHTVEKVLSLPAPAAPEPGSQQPAASIHYSVDLAFRFLPDLERWARRRSPQDPLIEQTRRWGESWPLSSVGMQDVVPRHVDVLTEHPGLLRYYADRIIARRDAARLEDPQVLAAVHQAIGIHAELAPELAAACAPNSGATS
jgi:hypothetical protein